MSSSPNESFRQEVKTNVQRLVDEAELHELSYDWINKTAPFRYSYNFRWLGRPIIQFPQDIVAVQEIVWETRPDLIIETGVAHGGSLILSASCLQLLGGNGKVLGIDVEIRSHNREAIEAHPLSDRITLLEGSSTSEAIIDQVHEIAGQHQRIMVMLDSNHTHEHVRRELDLFAPLVSSGCYLIVFDTIIEQMGEDAFPQRPWGRGDNPHTAVRDFLAGNSDFQLDRDLACKLLLTVAPYGYLRRT